MSFKNFALNFIDLLPLPSEISFSKNIPCLFKKSNPSFSLISFKQIPNLNSFGIGLISYFGFDKVKCLLVNSLKISETGILHETQYKVNKYIKSLMVFISFSCNIFGFTCNSFTSSNNLHINHFLFVINLT